MGKKNWDTFCQKHELSKSKKLQYLGTLVSGYPSGYVELDEIDVGESEKEVKLE